MDLTWVSSNSKRTTQTSQIIGPSKLGGKPSRQILVQEIINMEPQLSMTPAPHCYGESEPSDNENDRHNDKVEVEEEDGEYEKDGQQSQPVN